MLEKSPTIEKTRVEGGDVINLVAFPSIMGNAAYIAPLIPFFERLNDSQLEEEELYPHFFLNVFGARDDRISKKNLKESDSRDVEEGVDESNVNVELQARKYAHQILDRRITGPCFLLGWSFGGYLAYEVYRELENLKNSRDKQKSKLAKAIKPYVILIDTEVPSRRNQESFDSQVNSIFDAINDVVGNLKTTFEIRERLRVNRGKVSVEDVKDIDGLIEKFKSYYNRCRVGGGVSINSIIDLFEDVFFPNIRAVYAYNPTIMQGMPMSIISSTDTVEKCEGNMSLGWNCNSAVVQGANHYNLFTKKPEDLFGEIDIIIRKQMAIIAQRRAIYTLLNLEPLSPTLLLDENTTTTLRKLLLLGDNKISEERSISTASLLEHPRTVARSKSVNDGLSSTSNTVYSYYDQKGIINSDSDSINVLPKVVPPRVN